VAAESHVAACDDCREILADVLRLEHEHTPKAAIYWGWRGVVPLAAAAGLILFLGSYGLSVWRSPERQLDRAVTQLARAVGTERSIAARVSGGFEWGPPPVIVRGGDGATLSFDAQQATLTIRRLATEHPSARALGAAGVASLIAGDVDDAISTLEAAAAHEAVDGRILADLSAAHVERWRRSRAPADAAAALDAAERALLRDPADPIAGFNQAMAVEALGMRDVAIARWRAYLDTESDPAWAAEARERLARLEEGARSPTGGGAPPAIVPASLSAVQRDCFVRGYDALAASRVAFDASRLIEAETLARGAARDLACAGVSTVDADAARAWALFFQSRTEDALAIADRLLAAGQDGPPASRGRMFYVRALSDIRAGRLSEADAGYEAAIDAFATAGDREMEAAAWVLRSAVARVRSDGLDAWAGLTRAFAAMPDLGARRRHLTYVNAISTAEWFGLYGAASFFADALVSVNEPTGNATLQVGAYLQGARTRLALGQHEGALAFLERASSTGPGIADETLRAQYAVETDLMTARVLAGRDPATAVGAFNRVVDAFDPSTQRLRRARALLGRGQVHARLGQLDAAERDWVEGAALFEDQRPEIRDDQWRVDSRDELWGLFRELLRVRAPDPMGTLEIAERVRGRALLEARARGSVVTPLSGSALYQWLPADVTVIAYAVLADVLFRWTITADGVSLDRLDVSADDLTSLVDAHASEVARGLTGGGLRLSELLLPENLVPERAPRLVFLPDGPLYRVAFAALPLSGSGRLVVDDYVSQVAPSLTLLRSAGRSPSASSRAVFVAAGDPQPREGLPALPGVSGEVRAVSTLYRAPRVLEDRAATPAAMLAALPTADVLHFAGHVVTDAVMPSRSRLLLSAAVSPFTVSFGDLRGIAMPPGATVVLSACDGASGRVFIGEGAVGLPFVFLANGASSVVAALWQVDDAAPPEFWIDVHRGLLAGAAPAAALAESQRRSRQSGTSASVWAAFTVIGGLVQS
jgi:tetratricopeptide (TPR) repeat protein